LNALAVFVERPQADDQIGADKKLRLPLPGCQGKSDPV
jgi:hypothetical protein